MNNLSLQDDINFKDRLIFTLQIIFFIRLGVLIPIPDVDLQRIDMYFFLNRELSNILTTFSNQKVILSLFSLNIYPYITASIIVQLLCNLIPPLKKLREEGELKGQRYINRLTRLITLLASLVQSVILILNLNKILFNFSDLFNYSNSYLFLQLLLWLITGSMILLWFSELVDDYGLGNGSSLILFSNIISNLPNIFFRLLLEIPKDNYIIIGFIFIIITIILIASIISIQKTFKPVKLFSVAQLNLLDTESNPQIYKENSESSNDIWMNPNYIPLQCSQSGVLPIIFATTLLILPKYILENLNFSNFNLANLVIPNYIENTYWIFYFIVIVTISSIYARILINPDDLAKRLQKMSIRIKETIPGRFTAFYLKQTQFRVTTIGASGLALLVIFTSFIETKIGFKSLSSLSITSLIIIAGIALELLKKIRTYISNQNNFEYD